MQGRSAEATDRIRIFKFVPFRFVSFRCFLSFRVSLYVCFVYVFKSCILIRVVGLRMLCDIEVILYQQTIILSGHRLLCHAPMPVPIAYLKMGDASLQKCSHDNRTVAVPLYKVTLLAGTAIHEV